jgi:hypothetical protein
MQNKISELETVQLGKSMEINSNEEYIKIEDSELDQSIDLHSEKSNIFEVCSEEDEIFENVERDTVDPVIKKERSYVYKLYNYFSREENSIIKHEVIADIAREETELLNIEKLRIQKELENVKVRELHQIQEKEKIQQELRVRRHFNIYLGI